MKKWKMVALALGASSMLGAVAVSADVVDNGDGTQTVDNGTGSVVNEAEVSVKGYLGLDNTDPGNPEPEDPNKWVKVTLPTAVLFQATESSKFSDIASPDYQIFNHSGRPVQISVKDYSMPNVGSVDALNITATGNNTNVKLVESNKISVSPSLLMKLNPEDSTAKQPIQGVTNNDIFKFNGKTLESWQTSPDSKSETLAATLNLNLVPLDEDGNTYP